MTGAADDRPTIAPSGRGSAFDDIESIYDEATARRDTPAVPPAAPAAPAATVAAKAAPVKAAARKRPVTRGPSARREEPDPQLAAAIPMPKQLDSGTTRPLNVRVPAEIHFQMKVATLGVASDMQFVVNHLITIFLRDPQLVMRLIAEAESEGWTLGNWVHGALAALEND